ncbi:MAG: alpha/beta fold hydrolase, partial [Deltaproteobacteria bacterium]|nr:alpha/beta fold hydrolase [Deltaproteobacteria bacterium]
MPDSTFFLKDIPPYQSPWWLPSSHLQTVYPVLFRNIVLPPYGRERLELHDGDFLNLDWLLLGNKRLVIISHGLEGHSKRAYVMGMAQMAINEGWDVLAWNFRGCGGENNRLPRLYCNADTEDLHAVLSCAEARGYSQIALVGFSMGANVNLLYLGREASRVPECVVAAVAISAPCDLKGCANALARPECKLYMKRFLAELRKKLEIKQRQFPHLISLEGYEKIKDFRGFDDRYTAPFHGFANAEDYWERCSCLPRLESIRVPTLLINAANDPFLSPSCYPPTLQNRL